MYLFIPRSLCALKRVAAKSEHVKFGATQGIRITLAPGLYRAEATDGRRAMVVQGLTPSEEPPWPGFRELPDDACEAVILPKDLARACKVGADFLQTRFNMLGIATMGNDVCLGLGSDLVTARTVEGRFPNIRGRSQKSAHVHVQHRLEALRRDAAGDGRSAACTASTTGRFADRV